MNRKRWRRRAAKRRLASQIGVSMTCQNFCPCCGKPAHQHAAPYNPYYIPPSIPQYPGTPYWGAAGVGILTGGLVIGSASDGVLMN